jgi:hypothetical protein
LAERFIAHHNDQELEVATPKEFVKHRIAVFGRFHVARELNVDPSYLGRVMAEKVALSSNMLEAIKTVQAS